MNAVLAALGLVEPAAASKRHGFRTQFKFSANSSELP